MMNYTVTCDTSEDTQRFGEKLGKVLKGGEIIQLIGDVGAGKTTFVRGLTKGLSSSDHVSSPTFTICNTYHGRLTIQHCDFYRLSNDKLIEKELEELVSDQSVVVLEWAENIRGLDSNEGIVISIEVSEDEARTFGVNSSDIYNYLKI